VRYLRRRETRQHEARENDGCWRKLTQLEPVQCFAAVASRVAMPRNKDEPP
jgi:hypothetical protein